MVRGTHPAGEIVRSIAAQAETLLGRF